jgi:hypothetical protein
MFGEHRASCHILYIHTYIHVHIYTCIHTYIHTYVYTCMHTCTHTRIHIDIYLHTCMHACIHTYWYIYLHTCIHAYIFMYIYTHAYMHTYWYICTYTWYRWHDSSLYKRHDSYMHTCIHIDIYIYIYMIQVHQGTVDTFLEGILSQSVEQTSRKQVFIQCIVYVYTMYTIYILYIYTMYTIYILYIRGHIFGENLVAISGANLPPPGTYIVHRICIYYEYHTAYTITRIWHARVMSRIMA